MVRQVHVGNHAVAEADLGCSLGVQEVAAIIADASTIGLTCGNVTLDLAASRAD
ncbi:hypothetical protein ACT3SQ_08865 [Brachybacterium sp. AOP42-C2-15]|uniref:hypothetical protein n=1 Tax=Brachybacterium sp. AOP42-C2-15 TaxID=3457670 RepID=UPI004034987E